MRVGVGARAGVRVRARVRAGAAHGLEQAALTPTLTLTPYT